MSLNNILIALVVALVAGITFKSRLRTYGLMTVSVVALYWLQPAMGLAGYEIWLPTLILVLVIISWGFTSESDQLRNGKTWITGLFLVLLVAGLEYLSRVDVDFAWFIRSPLLFYPSVALVLVLLLSWGLSYLPKLKPVWLWIMVTLLIAIFIAIKLPAFSEFFNWFLFKASARFPGQRVNIQPNFDLRWFGFSYIAFRLLHTLRDRQTGRLPQVTLPEYITYVIFFPALAAGPIDRIERFVKELRQPLVMDANGWLDAGQRLVVGLFKKFVLVDVLSYVALTPANAEFVRSTGWMWILLYGYALQIYLDFSGYTDIAIGLGRFMGIKLPENFNNPYIKPNLTQFWNNWHMTLTQWFRAYFFNPLTRSMRSSGKFSIPLTILITQVLTMVLIGLWHGITWNFALWGLWHGLGLFIQNRWTEFVRPRAAKWLSTSFRRKTAEWLGVFVTFNFVAFGWVFFGFPSIQQSLLIFQKLFGF